MSAVSGSCRVAETRHPESDALVVFGVTGDLAFKKIIPSIYGLTRRGRLAGPVIGMGREPWSLARMQDRAAENRRQRDRAARRMDAFAQHHHRDRNAHRDGRSDERILNP